MRKQLTTTVTAGVLAATGAAAAGPGLFGGLEGNILDSVVNILTYPIPVTHFGLYTKSVIPFWILAASFIVLFCVLWLASGMLPLFTDDKARKPRIWFSIAISFIVLFSTQFLDMFLKIVTAFTSISIIALLIVGVYTIWVIAKGGFSNMKGKSATYSGELATANSTFLAAETQNAKTEDTRKKLNDAEKKTLSYERSNIKDARGKLQNVLKDLTKAQKDLSFTPPRTIPSNTHAKLLKDVEAIVAVANKLQENGVESDRIGAMMYGGRGDAFRAATPAPALPGSSSAAVTLEKGSAKMREDFMRTITGIPGSLAGGWTLDNVKLAMQKTIAAINLTTQMEENLSQLITMVSKF